MPEVHDLAELRSYEIGMSSSHIGSGGMRSKVLAAEMATSAGIPVVICNGTRAGHAAAGRRAASRSGTRFHPQARRESSFKLWLKYAKSARGTVLVDPGAERALREQGTSLLPVGVVEVEGDFEAGDAVDVAAAADGRRPIGKGISNYSAAELRRVKGLKSAQVREVLPARERGGRAPRLLRAGLSGHAPLPFSAWRSRLKTVAEALRAGEGGLARAGDARRRDEGRGAAGDRARARVARGRDRRGERRRPRGRPRRRPRRERCSTGSR